MKHLGVVLIVALLLPSAVAGNPGDAGSGADAPNQESAALLLAGDGTYYGSLARSDADWYSTLDATGGIACYTLQSLASTPSDISLVLRDGGVRHEARASRAAWEGARIALAAARLDDARVGIVNTGGSSGGYGFALEGHTTDDFATDANSGGDAPGDAASAITIGAGCTGGRVGGILDRSDAMRFDGNAGDVALLSLASSSSDVRLDLLDENGAVLGSIVGGQVLSVALPESDTYTIAASSNGLGATDYLIGLVVGPPGQGCRPMCLSG